LKRRGFGRAADATTDAGFTICSTTDSGRRSALSAAMKPLFC